MSQGDTSKQLVLLKDEKEKEEKAGEKSRPVINSDEFVELDMAKDNLPYLKNIELVRFKPQHFDLDKWKPSFKIPNHMMKRIYLNDVYRDTDFPDQSVVEKLSLKQKKLLRDHLDEQYKRFYSTKTSINATKTGISTRSSQAPPVDSLEEILDKSYCPQSKRQELTEKELQARRRTRQGQPLCSLNSDNIAVCYAHRVQPEEVIVDLALEKMKMLSAEEEKTYQELLKDQEFMQALNSHVERYLQSNDVSLPFVDEPQVQQQHNDSDQTCVDEPEKRG